MICADAKPSIRPAVPSASTQNRRLAAAIASGADPQTFGVPAPANDPSARLFAPSRARSASDGGGSRGGGQADPAAGLRTETPIKHVVVIIGENHTFDNVFATYRARHDQYVRNLLSEGIVNANGQFGPNVGRARQLQATDTTTYSIHPRRTGPYVTLPQPNTTSAQGQPQNVPDSRFPANLPNGPYQITKYVPYNNAFVGDPLHRFYQMAQEIGRNQNRLWTWVHQTAGDDNGAIPPAPIHQGALEMGYYNVQQGDASVLKQLADNYASPTTITRRCRAARVPTT